MGRFDQFEESAPAQGRTECPVAVQAVRRAALAIPDAPSLKTRAYRAQLVKRLRAEGWHCREGVRVDSRGTNDGYRGILDLVAHPPGLPGTQPMANLPVLIEIDKASIQRKTRAKLDRWEGPHAGKVVILTRASSHPDVEGLDAIIPLA